MSLQCFYQMGVVTYFELNRDYIAKVLCINREKPVSSCHGQCFLSRNLDLANEATTDEGTVPAGTQKVDFPVFLVTGKYDLIPIYAQPERGNSRYLLSTSTAHLITPFRPPTL